MKFAIGEKVTFLNENRTGIVKKYLNKDMVSVEIADGFEIPVMLNELATIHISIDSDKNLHFTETALRGKKDSELTAAVEENNEGALFLSAAEKVKQGMYLAFVPSGKAASSDSLQILLINHSAYDVLFTCYLAGNREYKGIAYDMVYAETYNEISTIHISDIEQWANWNFQFLFYRENAQTIKSPETAEIKLNLVKFYRENSYQHCSLLDKSCMLIALTGKQTGQEIIVPQNPEQKKDDTVVSAKQQIVEEHLQELAVEKLPAKYVKEKGIAEIDIHIWELVESYQHLSAEEMLKIQLNFFIQYLESAIVYEFSKVVFIHGVGNGRLKAEIRKIVADSYPELSCKDAPIGQYGVGATVIEIPQNINRALYGLKE